MMPVLHIATRTIKFGDGVGGLERAAGDHVMKMAECGVEVCVHSPLGPNGESWPGRSKIVPWPAHAPRIVAYSLWMSALAKNLERCVGPDDIVHVHGAASGALARRRQVAPSVVNPHGMEEFSNSPLIRVPVRLPLRHAGRAGAQVADRVIATDSSLIPITIQNLRVPPSKVTLIPNSIAESRLALLGAAGSNVPTQHAGAIRVVSVGRLVYNKGYDLLAQALGTVADASSQHIHWVHFGSGPERESVYRTAAKFSHLTASIIGGASDADVQTNIRSCRLFVQPSRYEGSSLTVLEAMTQGATIIGTPVGGIPDKILDGETGFLADHPTADGIAHAVRRALSSPSTGRAAQRLVHSAFSDDASMKKYLQLYAELSVSWR